MENLSILEHCHYTDPNLVQIFLQVNGKCYMAKALLKSWQEAIVHITLYGPFMKFKLIFAAGLQLSKCRKKIPYSALIWWSFILAIGDLRLKLPLLKPPIINAHAHTNACVHQITRLKTINYIFMG